MIKILKFVGQISTIELFDPDILRNLLVITLKTSDSNKVATREGWQYSADKMIVPPPAIKEAA